MTVGQAIEKAIYFVAGAIFGVLLLALKLINALTVFIEEFNIPVYFDLI